MKEEETVILPDPYIIKAIILKKYPAKIAKKREKSMVVNDRTVPKQIQSNVRTVHQGQRSHHTGRHYAARLHVCRL